MELGSTGVALALNLINIGYVAWVLGASDATRRWRLPVALVMLAWLGGLHVGLSRQALFPATISGPAFLAVIVAGVGAVAALLFLTPVSGLMRALSLAQLQLLQGIRVWFGAAFLVWAVLGVLPTTFGVIDGVTHVGAGFLGLMAAFSCAAGATAKARVWFATLFGLVDILTVASTLALVLLPQIGSHHPMMYAVFLPAPLWLCLHLVSMDRLMQGAMGDAPRRPVHAS